MDGSGLAALVETAAARLRAVLGAAPGVAMILGSGLGGIAGAVESPRHVPCAEIEGYPKSTVEGHEGTFVAGTLAGVPVVVLKGRIHAYEGHSPAVAALGARILARLKPRVLVLTNAAGGVNRDFRPGDLMQITDHLNLTGVSPLEGPNVDAFGPRFPDMSAVYPVGPRQAMRKHAEALGCDLRQGVYAWLKGPQYETPSEIRMLRILGADAVGMSTVPEAIVASHMKVPVLGMSLITNLAAGMSGGSLSHAEVLAQAEKSGKLLGDILMRSVPDLAR